MSKFLMYLEKVQKPGDVPKKAKKYKDPKRKFKVVMDEWKKGKLHSGRGKGGKLGKTVPVTPEGQKQAVAIAANVAGISKKKK